jgi:dihydroceramidase
MYWGEATSSIEWCEQNYEYSPYIAEFWNSVSSLIIAGAGFVGCLFALKFLYRVQLLLAYFAIMVVGLGSVAFHATLTRWGQSLDVR